MRIGGNVTGFSELGRLVVKIYYPGYTVGIYVQQC